MVNLLILKYLDKYNKKNFSLFFLNQKAKILKFHVTFFKSCEVVNETWRSQDMFYVDEGKN